MSQVIIRKATPADMPSVVAQVTSLALFEQSPFNAAGKEEKLSKYIFGSNPCLYCIVAVQGEDIAGFAMYSVEFSVFEAAPYLRLNTLYVASEKRGTGIGKAIITRLKEEAATMHCDNIRLFTPGFNTGAIAFYHAMGATSRNAARFYLPC